MRRILLGSLLGAILLPAGAQVSEIYRCIGENGRPLYTSEKRDTEGKQCQVVQRTVSVVPAPPKKEPAAGRAASVPKAEKNPGPASFPRETASSRSSARDKQREILEREVGQEKALLAKAKQLLAEQEAIRQGDERNYAKVLERLKPYQDTVELHEKNVEALERELQNLSR